MKPDSTKMLRTALEYLNIVKDCGSLNEGEIKFSVGEAISAIESVFYMETPNTSRKFDLYKIASTDELRPAMCGIFHDQGYKVACDGHILVAVKDAYDDALEGKIIDRKGSAIKDQKYPNWESVFPRKMEESDGTHTIDTAKVYEVLKAQKAEQTAAGRYGTYRRAFVKCGDTFFLAESLAKVCTFMDAYGCAQIKTFGPRRAAVVEAPDGSKALVMPCAYAKYANERGWEVDNQIAASVWAEHHDACLWYESA